MYNQKLVRLLKIGSGFILALVFISLGYGGAIVKQKLSQPKTNQTTQASAAQTSKNEAVLTEKEVKDFLIAYYTKTDLGENRSRYKPFMTESLYDSAVLEEEKPVSQAYQGYVVDQTFTEATIYIDQTNHSALVQVTYENVLLQEKDNRQSQRTTRRATDSLRLKYMEQDGRYVVSYMEPIILTDTSQTVISPYYEESSTSSTETSSSSN